MYLSAKFLGPNFPLGVFQLSSTLGICIKHESKLHACEHSITKSAVHTYIVWGQPRVSVCWRCSSSKVDVVPRSPVELAVKTLYLALHCQKLNEAKDCSTKSSINAFLEDKTRFFSREMHRNWRLVAQWLGFWWLKKIRCPFTLGCRVTTMNPLPRFCISAANIGQSQLALHAESPTLSLSASFSS